MVESAVRMVFWALIVLIWAVLAHGYVVGLYLDRIERVLAKIADRRQC